MSPPRRTISPTPERRHAPRDRIFNSAEIFGPPATSNDVKCDADSFLEGGGDKISQRGLKILEISTIGGPGSTFRGSKYILIASDWC